MFFFFFSSLFFFSPAPMIYISVVGVARWLMWCFSNSDLNLNLTPRDLRWIVRWNYQSVLKVENGSSVEVLSTHRRIQPVMRCCKKKKKKRGRPWCNGEQGLSCLGLDFTVMKMFECCWSVKLLLLTAPPTFEHDEITLLEQAVWTASQWDTAAVKITDMTDDVSCNSWSESGLYISR